jgi:hypothetical protein
MAEHPIHRKQIFCIQMAMFGSEQRPDVSSHIYLDLDLTRAEIHNFFVASVFEFLVEESTRR